MLDKTLGYVLCCQSPALFLAALVLIIHYFAARRKHRFKAVLKLLQDTCRNTGRTVIVITHNQALTAMADRVIRIKNGTVLSNETNPDPTPVERIEW